MGSDNIKPGDPLTPREQQAIDLVAAEGVSNREIAERMGVSAHTAKFFLHRAMVKLGARTRHQAAIAWLGRRSPASEPAKSAKPEGVGDSQKRKRKSMSLNVYVYDAICAEAKRDNKTCSRWVTELAIAEMRRRGVTVRERWYSARRDFASAAGLSGSDGDGDEDGDGDVTTERPPVQVTRPVPLAPASPPRPAFCRIERPVKRVSKPQSAEQIFTF